MWATRLIGQRFQAAGLIAFTPGGDRLPRDAIPFGYFAYGRAVDDFRDGTQTDLDSDTSLNIGIRLKELWIDHHETVAGAGCSSTMSR